jgi:hypothetical protein
MKEHKYHLISIPPNLTGDESPTYLQYKLRYRRDYTATIPRFFTKYYGCHIIFAIVDSTTFSDSNFRVSFAAPVNFVSLALALPLDVWSQAINIAKSDAVCMHIAVARVMSLDSIAHIAIIFSQEGLDLSGETQYSGLWVSVLHTI